MHAAVGLFGIVRTFLVFALQKAGLKQISKMIPDGGCVLVPQQGRVQLVDVAFGKRVVTFDELDRKSVV